MMMLTSSDAERRHCTAACFFISSRLRSVPPFFLLLPHFFPVPFSQPKKMSFSFQTQTEKSSVTKYKLVLNSKTNKEKAHKDYTDYILCINIYIQAITNQKEELVSGTSATK